MKLVLKDEVRISLEEKVYIYERKFVDFWKMGVDLNNKTMGIA